jgi:hypothetical protein
LKYLLENKEKVMSRTRLNQYLKKLGVIIFLAILAFIILTLITKMFINNDNKNNALDKELVDKNTSIYQKKLTCFLR